MAAGEHFASEQFLSDLPVIVGFDGIEVRPDGKLVGFGGTKAPCGAMAEKTVVPKQNTILIPEGVHAVTAAVLPAPALTSLFPFQWTAKLRPGETVLINGATGIAVKLAVQIAKLLGASKVVGTGRNLESLKQIKELGADAIIDFKLSDAGDWYDVILDFLWGRPTEVLMQTLIPRQIGYVSKSIRLVQVGDAAGKTISLPANALLTIAG